MIQRRFAILLAGAVIAGAVAYFAAQDRGLIGEMRVQALAGAVTIDRDGEEQTVNGEATIEPGDVIRTSSQGLAKLRLTDDRLAWLATSTRVGVVGTATIEIQTGRFLGHARDAMSVEFDGVTAQAIDATFRIDQGTGSSRAAAYSGAIELAAPGQPRFDLPTLFEAPISAGRLPRAIRPLQLRSSEWDLASVPRDEVPALGYLEEILELDETLTRRGDGLETQLGRERPRLSYFKGLAGRKVGFMRPLLKRPVKDLLIGFTIAQNVEDGLKKAMRRTFKLRDDGGRWGIVAAIQEAKPKVLVSELSELILAATRVGGGGGAGVQEASFTLAAGSGTTTPGSDDPPPPGDETEDPKDPEDPDEDPECTDDDPECVIDEVTKNLPDPGPTPSDPPLLDL